MTQAQYDAQNHHGRVEMRSVQQQTLDALAKSSPGESDCPKEKKQRTMPGCIDAYFNRQQVHLARDVASSSSQSSSDMLD